MDPALQVSGLGGHGLAMLVLAGIAFAVLIWDRFPIATVCLMLLGALTLGFALFPFETPQGTVDPALFFEGFGHPALIAICALMVLGHGLVLTGALEPAARRLAGWLAVAPRLAPLGLLAGAAVLSGLINDTPVVVLLIPLIVSAARRSGGLAASLLLPMNYAVLIGGMATTIGTSTNLIVVAMAAEMGVGPLPIFGFSALVAVAAIPALLYLWIAAPRMLAHVPQSDEDLVRPVFDAELLVEAGSWLDGRELREALNATSHRLNLVGLWRENRSLPRLPTLKLRAGDRLLVQDTAVNLKDAESSLHAALHGVDLEAAEREVRDGRGGAASAVVAQMIITRESPLVGRSVRQERVAERYGLVVVGLRSFFARQGWEREHPADRPLAVGDVLLVQGRASDIQHAQRVGVGLLLDVRFALPRQRKAPIAILTLLGVILLAATGTLPIAAAALAGVLVLLFSRCLSWEEVTESLSVKVVLLVAASLGLGRALEITGATGFLAGQVAAHTQGLGAAWVLALLMALMGLLTNFVSNNAAAAIGTPLAIELARILGAPPEPLVLAVLFGCNLCYLTPMGYQTNLLVMSAGGYRFADYIRVGAPLFVLMWGALSYALVRFYGLV